MVEHIVSLVDTIMPALAGIDLHDLEILEAVAREASFSVAARALNLSRADVSRTIARMEQRLDLRLFTRTTRRVGLTDAGRELVRRLRPAMQEIVAALEHASPFLKKQPCNMNHLE